MLEELRDYGWVLSRFPLEYVPGMETMWVHLEHAAFPEMHLSIEIHFKSGLSTKAKIIVSDDNIDRAGDSADVLSQGKFDVDAIWKACEEIMERRKTEWI